MGAAHEQLAVLGRGCVKAALYCMCCSQLLRLAQPFIPASLTRWYDPSILFVAPKQAT